MARGCVSDDELLAYIERQAGPAERAAIDGHVAGCDGCRALLAAAVGAIFDGGQTTRPAGGEGWQPAAPPTLTTVPYASYIIGGEIARGGLGRVVQARDQRLGRPVALKELLRKDAAAEARFIHEATITARLEHPAIVPVHEAGRWPDGEPFYAMKLVSGMTLMERIRQLGTLGERLALLPSLLAVAEAIAYAHSRGIIHRDLKPQNVLVGQFGETVVIDWGLAKEIGAPEAAGPEVTESGGGTIAGTVMGTPRYMAPEQARGEPVDERGDVYALGAILYELLCGAPPYADLATDDVLAAVAARPPRSVEAQQEGVPRDLAAIVRKAMARTPADRYRTASKLAADLGHFLTGQLVSAREYSRWALIVRWLRRFRVPAAAAGAALVAVATLGGLSLTRVFHERRVAEAARVVAEGARQQAEARQAELVLLQARALVDRDPTRALAWLKLVPATAPLWTEGRAVAVEAVSRGFARHAWRTPERYTSVRFSPDGRWVISAGSGRALRVVDAATGEAHPLDLGGPAVLDAAFAADGRLAVASDDGTLSVFPAAALRGAFEAPRVLRPGTRPVRNYVAMSGDGRLVAAAANDDGVVVLWDLASDGVRTFRGSSDGVRGVAFSPDGLTLATVSVDRVLRLRDLAGGATRELVGADVGSQLVFSHDGARLLVAELSGIREWTLATGASRLLPLPRMRLISVAESDDGRLVAAAGFEGAIAVLDVASGEVATLHGHEALVTGLDFSPDGRLLVSSAMDGGVRVWQLPERRDRILGRVAGTAAYPVFSPDGATVAAGAGDGTIALLPVGAGEPRALAGHRGQVLDVEFAPGGRRLASHGSDRTVRLWDLDRGTSRVVARTASWVDFGRLRFSPDGRLLAASLALSRLSILDAESGAPVCTFDHGGFNLAHAFSPDGRAIVYTNDDEVRLGDTASCSSRVLYRHDPRKSCYELAFSDDGRTIASASDDGTIGVHDLRTGVTRRLRGHESEVTSAVFLPDGRTLASAGNDRTVRIWDLPTGTARVLRGHDLLVSSVSHSPDGSVVASSSLDGTVRLWDPLTGAGLALRGHRDRIVGMAFSPDGRWLASGSRDGTVRLWPADARNGVPVEGAELRAWLEEVTSARIDPDNRATTP